MYLALDATAVPAFASTGSSSATTMERFPEGEVNILADEDCFAEALNAVFQATADRRGQARGDVMRQQGTYRPRIKPISLPRTSSKRPTPKGMAFISTAIAGARLASWKAEAARQARGEIGGRNAHRTVISLFDASGVLAQPWVDAGHNVVTYDLQTGGDISQFDAENLLEQHGNDDVWAILAQHRALASRAAAPNGGGRRTQTAAPRASNELERQTLRTIKLFRPPV